MGLWHTWPQKVGDSIQCSAVAGEQEEHEIDGGEREDGSAVRRTAGSRKSMTGQSPVASGWRASLRRCSHMPNGMSSRPIRKTAGRATKTTRPA